MPCRRDRIRIFESHGISHRLKRLPYIFYRKSVFGVYTKKDDFRRRGASQEYRCYIRYTPISPIITMTRDECCLIFAVLQGLASPIGCLGVQLIHFEKHR